MEIINHKTGTPWYHFDRNTTELLWEQVGDVLHMKREDESNTSAFYGSSLCTEEV